MASPYAQLLRTPHAWPFSLAGFFARLPLSMGGLALLLMMVEITDSYFVAGAVDAAWILVGAFAAPGIAMLIDRFGQRRVIGPQMAVHVVGVAALLALAATDAPLWTFFVAAAVSGAALPVVGAAVRARWSHLLAQSPLLRTAYSWESVVDEFVFVVGPPLAAGVAASVGAGQALALTAAIGATGTVAFLAQGSSEPPPRPEAAGEGRLALRHRGMPTVFLVMVMLGVVFAGVEVTVIATARESGQTAVAGVILALWAVSSMTAGLVVGAMRRLPPLHVQLALGSTLTAALLTPLLVVEALPGMATVLFFAGAGVAPALIAGFALAARLVPPSALTQALTWTSTAIAAGFALGSPTTGWLVDEVSPRAGYWVAIAAAVVAGSSAAFGRSALRSPYTPSGEASGTSTPTGDDV